MLFKVYCDCCQSSGDTDLALPLTAYQIVQSKGDKEKIPLPSPNIKAEAKGLLTRLIIGGGTRGARRAMPPPPDLAM